MDKQKLPATFIERLKKLKSKRAKVVANHILEHGFITTDDIRNYGYKDPYRPTMDLRDEGIPLESYKIKNQQGVTISAYKFGNPADVRPERSGGRKAFSRAFKTKLIKQQGNICAICLDEIEGRYLQIDHRVPYQIAGEDSLIKRDINNYMLLCRSCNRSKSWSCEQCDNFINTKNPKTCLLCYWGNNNNYEHIALQKIRRVDITWRNDEVTVYELLNQEASSQGISLAKHLKNLLADYLNQL